MKKLKKKYVRKSEVYKPKKQVFKTKALNNKRKRMNSEMNNNNNMGMSVTSLLLKTLSNASNEYARECIRRCSAKYGFSSEEALVSLNLENCVIQVKEMKKRSGGKAMKKVVEKTEKEVVVKKVQIPLPFMEGAVIEEGCEGLAYNCGLFTQCQKMRMSQSSYCKACQHEADMSASGAPTTGTVFGRMSVGMMEFRDGKGRSPVAYTKIMAKKGLSREAVEEAAGKLNLTIDEVHFAVVDEKKKVEKKASGAGRPKAAKKSKEVSAETVEDLFAQLVDEDEEDGSTTSTVMMSDSEDEEDKAREIGNEKTERGLMKDADGEMKKIVKDEKKAEELIVKAQLKETKAAEDLIIKAQLKETKAAEDLAAKELKASKLIEDKEQKVAAELAAKKQKAAKLIADKEQKAAKLIEDKEQKAAKLIADKEQKVVAELAAKKQKVVAELAAKEQKVAAELAAKEQKVAAELAAKKQKAAKLIADKEAKVTADLAAKELKAAKLIADKEAKVAAELIAKEQKEQAAKELKASKEKKAAKPEAKKAIEKAEAVTATVTEVPKKVTVKRITIDGKQYLKTADNLLYDPETREEMGIYDAETNTIKVFADEDDDEIEEDGYDSDAN